MKKIASLIYLFLSLIFFTACEKDELYPLDKPEVGAVPVTKINPAQSGYSLAQRPNNPVFSFNLSVLQESTPVESIEMFKSYQYRRGTTTIATTPLLHAKYNTFPTDIAIPLDDVVKDIKIGSIATDLTSAFLASGDSFIFTFIINTKDGRRLTRFSSAYFVDPYSARVVAPVRA